MKNILLAVSGLSPQVITETLYALNQMNRPVHAIHVITTRFRPSHRSEEMTRFEGIETKFARCDECSL